MTKLDELIQELCPDGVEYKELQEILTIKTEVIINTLVREIFPFMDQAEL